MDPGDAELAVKLGNKLEPMRNRHVGDIRELMGVLCSVGASA